MLFHWDIVISLVCFLCHYFVIRQTFADMSLRTISKADMTESVVTIKNLNSLFVEESISVNDNTAFDTLNLFIGIKTIVAATVAQFYALGIQHAYGRQLILFPLPSDFHDKFFYAMFYSAILPPFAEMPIDRLTLREVFGVHSPLTSADRKVKDGLKDGTQGIFTSSAIILKEYFFI